MVSLQEIAYKWYEEISIIYVPTYLKIWLLNTTYKSPKNQNLNKLIIKGKCEGEYLGETLLTLYIIFHIWYNNVGSHFVPINNILTYMHSTHI